MPLPKLIPISSESQTPMGVIALHALAKQHFDALAIEQGDLFAHQVFFKNILQENKNILPNSRMIDR